VTFYGGPVNSPWIGYGGGDYKVNDSVTVSLGNGHQRHELVEHPQIADAHDPRR
jgi:hypothetical protein